MIIEELFSRRRKKEMGDYSDIYQYDIMSENLRITLYKIFARATQKIVGSGNTDSHIYKKIHDLICEEHSFHYLGKVAPYNSWHYKEHTISFFNTCDNLLIQIDILQLFCLHISQSVDSRYTKEHDKETLKKILKEINQRLLEHSFGYQYEDGLIVRIDTKHTHNEIVKPTLVLLNDKHFNNANEEYRDAFEALKRQDYEAVFVECNKAFESTMKIICELNEFSYKQGDTSSKLIKTLSINGFIAGYNEDMLNGLIKVLTTISTLRNKEGGHGKGIKQEIVDLSYVNFALHSTASNILFLMERQKEFIQGKQN